MKIEEKNIKMWSVIGSRAAFGIAALEIAKKNKNLITLTCDVSTSAGLDRYRKTLPDQYLDLGIAEQNMIGVAAGLASENFDVITATFAPFQTMRCCEQIKVNIGYMKQNVCMVGLASGLVLGPLGYTHCCIEDIGVLRNIPGLTIISPADSFETVKATEASIKHDQSVYIRLTGGSNNPMVYESDYEFEIGKAKMLIDNGEILIISNGMMVKKSIDIANYFKERGVNISVINMHTIKPLDQDLLDKIISKYIHFAEKALLIFIAFATIFATIQEIIELVKLKRVLLADLLLLFIYTEVLGMVAAFYRSSRIPVTLPLFIAMTALARMIILQGKEPSDLLYEAGAIVLVAIACLIIRTRPPENYRANIEE